MSLKGNFMGMLLWLHLTSAEVLELIRFSKSAHSSNTYRLNLGYYIPSL